MQTVARLAEPGESTNGAKSRNTNLALTGGKAVVVEPPKGGDDVANEATKKARRDNRSNQLNPNNWRYHKARS